MRLEFTRMPQHFLLPSASGFCPKLRQQGWCAICDTTVQFSLSVGVRIQSLIFFVKFSFDLPELVKKMLLGFFNSSS